MFDVPPPLQSRGLNEYVKTWDLFFRYHKPTQPFDIEDMTIIAGEDVALHTPSCGVDLDQIPVRQRKADSFFRLTIGLRKIAGDWHIAHEHHSVPSTD